MAEVKRIEFEPVWLLHHRAFRDTSRILDFLTRDHGRVSVVARGVRSAKSRLKGALRVFAPLSISWVARSDLGTLTGAELAGPPPPVAGDALMSGYYVNELLLHLMHRHDPQPEIFASYAAVIHGLASADDVAPVLRRFELELLRLLGYEMNLEYETQSNEPLQSDRFYEYRVEDGPVGVDRREGPMVFAGAELQAIAGRRFDIDATLKAANRLLRSVIAYHLDGKELKSRRVLQEMRRADRPAKTEDHR